MGLRSFLRKVVPREIREPISNVTESLEDAVRPVTDPVRKFLSKAVPKEIKGILGSSAAIALGAGAGGPIGAFITAALADALAQKALTDPDAEDTGVSLESAILSGIGGSLKNVASTLPKTGPGDAIKSQTIEQMVGSEGVKATAPELVKSNTLRELTNLGVEAGQIAEPYLTAPSLDMGLKEGAKQALKFSTGMGTLRSPLVAQDIVEAQEDQEAAMAASEAAQKANYDELQKQRVASMLGSFERAGFEPEETQREIEEEGLTVSLADVQDYFNKVRQFVSKGGRIGFATGSGNEDDRDEISFNLFGKPYIELNLDEREELKEEMIRLRHKSATGGRVGFDNGGDTGGMTDRMGLGNYMEAEKVRTEFMDKMKRGLQAAEMNMKLNDPGLMRFINALPFMGEGFYTREEMRFPSMKERYEANIEKMKRDQARDDYEKRQLQKQLRKENFDMMVDMVDDRFSDNREQRKMAKKGGRMTPQGDPISPDVPNGMQMDLRGGGFIPLGTKPKADDVPAMVGLNEFVLNDEAVSGIGKLITGKPDPRAGARALYQLQDQMEAIV